MKKDPLSEYSGYLFKHKPKSLKHKRDTWFLFIRKEELEQLKYWDKFKHKLYDKEINR